MYTNTVGALKYFPSSQSAVEDCFREICSGLWDTKMAIEEDPRKEATDVHGCRIYFYSSWLCSRVQNLFLFILAVFTGAEFISIHPGCVHGCRIYFYSYWLCSRVQNLFLFTLAVFTGAEFISIHTGCVHGCRIYFYSYWLSEQ